MAVFTACLLNPSAQADDLPTGYQVGSGSATFTQTGNALNINASNNAIINYQSFNIGANHQVNIYSALSLHRVIGSDPSQIFGQLNSTGKVFLVNPNGIFFGQGSQVNVQGLTASTLNIRDDDFLAGRFQFQRAAGQAPGAIINQGDIQGSESATLLGGAVDNSGSIRAPQINLAVGDKITYRVSPGVGINVTVDEALQQKVSTATQAINNSGTLQGQNINLQAKLAQSFYETTVNNSGIIEATGLARNESGQVVAVGQSDDHMATLINTGTIKAQGQANGAFAGSIHLEADKLFHRGTILANDTWQGLGGAVSLLGTEVYLLDHSLVDASGASGGGKLYIGGDYLGSNPLYRNAQYTKLGSDATVRADALNTGDGGRIILWSDIGTEVFGRASVKGIDRGGFIETSGKQFLNVQAAPEIGALSGVGGTWLLDPNNLTITTGVTQTNINGASPFVTTNDTSSLGVNLINTALASGNVTISTGNGGTNLQAGDITWSTALSYTGASARTLTVNAFRNIALNAGISTTGSGLSLVFNANTGLGGGTFISNGSGTINTSGGSLSINAAAITLGAAVTATNANVDLTATGSTIGATAGILTGTGLLNLSAPTSVTLSNPTTSNPYNIGTVSTPSLSVTANGNTSNITLNNGFNGTTLLLSAQGTSSNIVSNADITTTGTTTLYSRQTNNTTGTITVNGNVSANGIDIRSGANNVTVTGNVTDTSTSGSSSLLAGSNNQAVTRTITLGGTLNIAAGAAKSISIFDGSGSIFSKAYFTDGGLRSFSTLDLRRADASGTLNLTTYTGLTLPSSVLTLQTTGTNGDITLPATAFNGTTLSLLATGTGSNITTNANITTTGNTIINASNTTNSGTITANGNITVGGIMDIRSYAGSVSINGNVSNTGTTGTNYLAAGSSTPTNARNLTVSGTLNIAGGVGKTLLIYDGDGDIFSKAYFTDGTARAIGSLDLRRADNNGSFNYPLFTGFAVPSTGLTLQTYGTNGNITTNGFTGTNLILQTNAAGGTVTVNGNVATTGTLTLSSFDSNVTVNGNVSNTLNSTGTTTLAAGATNFSAGSNLNITGTLAITNNANKNITIMDGDGDIFSKPFFNNALTAGTIIYRTRGNIDLGSLASPRSIAVSTFSAETGGNVYISDTSGTLSLQTAGTGVGGTYYARSVGNILTPATSTAGMIDWASTAGNGAITISNNLVATNGATFATQGTGGFVLNASRSVTTTNSPISITSYSYSAGAGSSINAGTGTVTLRPNTDIVTSFGTASHTAGTFDITTTEQGLITAGTVSLGNASHTSGINLINSLNVTGTGAGRYNLVFNNAGTYSSTGTTLTLGTHTVTVNATGGLTSGTVTGSAGGSSISYTTGGNLTLSNALTADAISLTTTGTSNTLALNSAITGNNSLALSVAGNSGITQSNAFTTTALSITGGTGTINLNNTANNASNLTLTAGSGSTTYRNAGSLTLNALTQTGGNIDIATQSGNIILTSPVSAANVTIAAFNNLTLNAGSTITATGSGNSLVLAAQGGAFTNNAGASPLSAASGRWLVYTSTPAATTLGGLTGGTSLYNRTYTGNAPGTITNTGNRILYNVAATILVTPVSTARTYGASNPSTTYTYSGYINGDSSANAFTGTPTYTTAATSSSNVGGYTMTGAAGSILSDLGYNFSYGTGTLTINPAALTITADSFNRSYGSSNPSFTASYSGFVLGQNSSNLTGSLSLSTPATNATNVGSYGITPSGFTSSNYAISYVPGTLTIDPAALTITADSFNRTYGSSNPSFTASYSGFVLGQNSSNLTGSLSLSTPATNATNVGSYGITPSGFTSSNYAISYVPGTLTIDPAALTITADSFNRTYGSSNPSFTASYSGFVLGQNSSNLSGSLSLSTPATNASNVGSYGITPSGFTSSNYAISYVPGTLTIDPAALTITANNASRRSGEPDPTFSASYSGFVLGQNASVLGGALSFSTPANSGSPSGTYSLTPGGYTSSNYAISYVPGIFTIDPPLPTNNGVGNNPPPYLLNPGQNPYIALSSPAANPLYTVNLDDLFLLQAQSAINKIRKNQEPNAQDSQRKQKP
ncbi:MAG: filamentous hemagglutinin N-terminal domain-containing protein [Cyanobacteria bacterium]|nr:filamentous hemagglutinin N-terminal domain-containing protein [Cyanobacteriota bacterium]